MIIHYVQEMQKYNLKTWNIIEEKRHANESQAASALEQTDWNTEWVELKELSLLGIS